MALTTPSTRVERVCFDEILQFAPSETESNVNDDTIAFRARTVALHSFSLCSIFKTVLRSIATVNMSIPSLQASRRLALGVIEQCMLECAQEKIDQHVLILADDNMYYR